MDSVEHPKEQKRIFLSHSHVDKGLTRALEDLLRSALRESKVDIHSSSSIQQGVLPGTDWRKEIWDTLLITDILIVILTPASIHSHWVMAEFGFFKAVKTQEERRVSEPEAGLTGVRRRSRPRKILPISFLQVEADIPEPIETSNYAPGLVRSEIMKMMIAIMDGFGTSHQKYWLSQHVDAYVSEAKTAYENTPMDRSDELVQSWIERFDALRKDNSLEDALDLQHMARVAFLGPDSETQAEELGPDLETQAEEHGQSSQSEKHLLHFRLHTRFGDLYREQGKHYEAAKEYKRALIRAPRDLLVMKNLALVYIKLADSAENQNTKRLWRSNVEKILDRMLDLDPQRTSVYRSSQLVTMIARFRATDEPPNYEMALSELKKYQGDDAFVTNNKAIYGMLAADGRLTPEVAGYFLELVGEELIDPARDWKDKWMLANTINGLLALGRNDEARQLLQLLPKHFKPNSGDWESATRYFDDICHAAAKESGTSPFDWKAHATKDLSELATDAAAHLERGELDLAEYAIARMREHDKSRGLADQWPFQEAHFNSRELNLVAGLSHLLDRHGNHQGAVQEVLKYVARSRIDAEQLPYQVRYSLAAYTFRWHGRLSTESLGHLSELVTQLEHGDENAAIATRVACLLALGQQPDVAEGIRALGKRVDPASGLWKQLTRDYDEIAEMRAEYEGEKAFRWRDPLSSPATSESTLPRTNYILLAALIAGASMVALGVLWWWVS